MKQIPLDSIVAVVPPTYRLNWVTTFHGKLKPLDTTPIQMMPRGYGDVEFKFWGFDNYDVHTAFPQFRHLAPAERLMVKSINYEIVVYAGGEGPSVCAHYEHKFRNGADGLVWMGLGGLTCRRPMFRFFKALEHLPKLPHDWQYMQFVG